MKKCSAAGFIVTFIVTIAAVTQTHASDASFCEKSDSICLEFKRLAEAEQFQRIIEKLDNKTRYSEESSRYVGQAYLALAADEKNTPEQEEEFCRKALDFGANQAYMGLYFLYAEKDETRALGFLKKYLATKPYDSVPYVILGESELERRNYQLADTYLRESKKVSRASSARVDWMLFQANYLLGNYAFAAEMFENAVSSGRFERDLKRLTTDSRFTGMERHPEFRKYRDKTAASRPGT